MCGIVILRRLGSWNNKIDTIYQEELLTRKYESIVINNSPITRDFVAGDVSGNCFAENILDKSKIEKIELKLTECNITDFPVYYYDSSTDSLLLVKTAVNNFHSQDKNANKFVKNHVLTHSINIMDNIKHKSYELIFSKDKRVLLYIENNTLVTFFK
jgi:hypothetical protein